MALAFSTLDLVRVRFWVKDGDQAAVNTVYYICTGPNTGGVTDLDASQSLQVQFNPLYIALLNNNAEWRGVQVQIVRTPTLLPAFDNSNPLIGTAGPIALPKQTASLVQYQSNFAGRKYRGRIYLPFPATADMALDGAPTAGYLTRLLAIKSALEGTFFFTDLTGTKFIAVQQVIPHFLKKGQVGPAESPTPVTTWTISSRWATQRRRGAFGRQNLSPI